jgi:hypothetical protein
MWLLQIQNRMEEVAPLTMQTEIVENQSQLDPRRLFFVGT